MNPPATDRPVLFRMPVALRWRDEALMLNLASFGPDEHQLFIQARIEGLRDLLALSREALHDRLERAATELNVEPPSDLLIEQDAPAWGRERFLPGQIAGQQPAAGGAFNQASEDDGDDIGEFCVVSVVSDVIRPADCFARIGDEEQYRCNGDLGPDPDRQSRKTNHSHMLIGC